MLQCTYVCNHCLIYKLIRNCSVGLKPSAGSFKFSFVCIWYLKYQTKWFNTTPPIKIYKQLTHVLYCYTGYSYTEIQWDSYTVTCHVHCSSALIINPYKMVAPNCLVDHSISEFLNSLSTCLWPYPTVSMPTVYESGLMRTWNATLHLYVFLVPESLKLERDKNPIVNESVTQHSTLRSK